MPVGYSTNNQQIKKQQKKTYLKITIMKTLISAFFVLSFLFLNTTGFSVENDNQQSEKTLQIVSSPELFDLASNWVAGYGILHPEQKIDLQLQSDETIFEGQNLYLLSNNHPIPEGNESAWKMVVGHDLVVPIINTKNPLLAEINKKGLTADDFARLISEKADWSMVINNAPNSPVKFYIVNNQNVITKIAGFTKTDEGAIAATKVGSAAEIISLVQQNVNAIGFCNLTDILNEAKDGFASQISVVPVDKNKNGRLDSFEKIYDNPAALTRGAWIGKYPRALCGDIYALATEKPTNQAALDFMTYITANGQELVENSGYSILSSAQKAANMLVLANPVPPSDPGKSAPAMSTGVMILIGFAAISVLLILLFAFNRRKSNIIESEDIEITPALNQNSILAPRGLYYDKTHTWAFMEKDGFVKIGIDDFLKHVTGSLTSLKMKSPGEKVRKGEKILTVIRDGKQLNLYSPVSGFIRKQNETLLTNPSKINTMPYTEGWVYQIEPVNWVREVSFMFMFDKYKEWLEDEFSRLRDFLALSANSNAVVYQHVVLQDGGELKDNVLADLGPEVWEDFQTRFIDTSK
jgi:glycine cleavage system H lipoate-binding protein/ABC-type phosphate transport system substrate-binding protein